MQQYCFCPTIFYLLLIFKQAKSSSGSITYNCDSDATLDNIKVNALESNKFHKICPRTIPNKPFSQPICGDGTNFSFFFSRPIQKKSNEDKVLIELMGGGACWNSETCDMQADYLTYPSKLDNFIGYSCSEVSYWAESGGDFNDANGNGRKLGDSYDISMLCAKSVGDVDFTHYNSIIIPYCTQDIHIGSSTTYYNEGDDDSASLAVNHMGAHNIISTLRWIFENFPNPSHFVLTGCSAGGSALPIMYDLINKHYNHRLFTAGMKSVSISVLADSPVYLTPTYFLKNAFPNWKPWDLFDKLNFNYNPYRYDSSLPDYLWDHVLKSGSNSDRWGMLSHTYDPVSMTYFQWMSGYNDNNERSRVRKYRFLEQQNNNDDDESSSEWWQKLNTSLTTIEQKHDNVDTFFMEGEGHCTIGLYYGLQYDGFEEWASYIMQERAVIGRTYFPSLMFKLSVIIAAGFVYLASFYIGKRNKNIMLLEQLNKEQQKQEKSTFVTQINSNFIGILTFVRDHPITMAYTIAISMYFWIMLCSSGFTHVLNNLAIGPSAVTLSEYGINNPSLVIYKHQIWRLLSSSFLCSGILTYGIAMYGLLQHILPLENLFGNTSCFLMIFASVSFGCNLCYCLLASNGASCAGLATVVGMTSFAISMRTKFPLLANHYPQPIIFTFLLSFVVALISSFDSWRIMLCSILIGHICAFLFEYDNFIGKVSRGIEQGKMIPSKKSWIVFFCIFATSFLLILFTVPRPDRTYTTPFLTGCTLYYTLEAYSDGCCQLCIPNIANPFLSLGVAELVSGYQVLQGTCEESGYDEHFLDKSFTFFTYEVDIEVYTQ